MVRISWQHTMMLLTLFVAGCATERPRLHIGSRQQPRPQAPAVPQDRYAPQTQPLPAPGVLEEEIPAPPSGASFEKSVPEQVSKLHTAERPPLLLRPIAWTFFSNDPVVTLKAPQPEATNSQSAAKQ